MLSKITKLFKKKRAKKASFKKTKVKRPLIRTKRLVRSISTKEIVVSKVKKSTKEEVLAEAIHYFSKIKVAVIKLKKSLKIGDIIRFKGFTTDFVQKVKSMQMDHQPIQSAKKGQEIGIQVKGKVRHKDKVLKA